MVSPLQRLPHSEALHPLAQSVQYVPNATTEWQPACGQAYPRRTHATSCPTLGPQPPRLAVSLFRNSLVAPSARLSNRRRTLRLRLWPPAARVRRQPPPDRPAVLPVLPLHAFLPPHRPLLLRAQRPLHVRAAPPPVVPPWRCVHPPAAPATFLPSAPARSTQTLPVPVSCPRSLTSSSSS